MASDSPPREFPSSDVSPPRSGGGRRSDAPRGSGDGEPAPRRITDAREIAAVRTARRTSQFPALEIGPLDLGDFAGDPRDAALASAIDHVVAKRWLTLEALLIPRLSRGWDRVEARLRGVLMVGTAQLLFLDRVPEHAAIHSSVELAKRLVRPGAAGLVNAVLRGIVRDRAERIDTYDPASPHEVPLSDGGAWRFTPPVMPEDPTERMAAALSIGRPLVDRWIASFGLEEAARIARHTLTDPPIVFAGATPTPPGPDETEPALIPHDRAGFHVFTGVREAISATLAAHPGARIQDPVSALPVAATAKLRPARILDACAGRGTKTVQLRELHPEAEIVAAEIDSSRLSILRDARRNDRRTTVVPWSRIESMDEPFDLIVLDVPCSNSGVLSRRVEARYRGDDATIGELIDMQRQIIADTIRILAPGGYLLYATCSLEPDENDRQVEWIVKWHRMTVEEQVSTVPAGGPGRPATEHTDGGGFALLRAPGA